MNIPKASPRRNALAKGMDERQFERLLEYLARLSIILLGCIAFIFALVVGKVVLLPVALAVIVGLMFGPVADYFERRGVPSALSAGILVLLLLSVIAMGILAFAVPLSDWISRLPAIWERLRTELLNWREPLEALGSVQDQLKSVVGAEESVSVTVEESNPVTDIAFLAPAILAEILVFLVSLYFYLATRKSIQMSILALFVSRRMRWRIAHVFREVETKVSRFLLSVTFLNICVGIVMAIATWWLGLPSPLLWGALAAVLNYIPYVGHAIMMAILLAVGFGTQTGLPSILAPFAIYLVVNFIEGQLIFPQFVGRAVTLNPFLIFLSIAFWIWAWGPFGALVAVPSLLIVQSLFTHVIPSPELAPRRPVRRTADMSEKDVVLANAATAIKEQAEDQAEAEARAEDAKHPPAPAVSEPTPPPPAALGAIGRRPRGAAPAT